MSPTGTYQPTEPTTPAQHPLTALIVGASRGLGHGMAAELLDRGWDVIGTVRDPAARTPLHDLADACARAAGDAHAAGEAHTTGRLTVEQLDVTDPAALPPLHDRLAESLADRRLDVLFVNAGTTTAEQKPIGEVTTEEFTEVMVTNALGPIRVIDALEDLVSPTGLIGAMSSGQGSIANNTTGGREVYRASKAALNMFLRSFAARQEQAEQVRRAVVLLAPGWIRTALGGPEAPYTLAESVPLVVDVLLSRLGTPGLAYLDRFGKTVPW